MSTVATKDLGALNFVDNVSVGIAGSGIALLSTFYFARAALSQSRGTPELQRLSDMIQTAAKAYLFTQYKWLTLWVACLFIIISIILRTGHNQLAGLYTALSYVLGSLLSAVAGYAGMIIATSSNARTAEACRTSISRGLEVSFASGAVMGNIVCALALIGLWVLYLIWSAVHPESLTHEESFYEVWGYLAGFGFGASSIGMFARVGGGVFTKAADVGSDLVGKVEQGIPEDDPRNPAVIADNVGDNVGDVAGMGADLFESYAGALIATATLAPALYRDAVAENWTTMTFPEVLNAGVALPFWVYGFGIVTSLVGIAAVRGAKLDDQATLETLLNTINFGVVLASVLSLGTNIIACVVLFDNPLSWRLFGATAIGLIAGVIIGVYTAYVTAYEYKPTRSISEASFFGTPPVIIKGLGVGMMSVSIPTISIVITILACNALAGLYGVSIAAVGMLCTLSITLATDAYGPVADNAGGLAEMAGLESYVRSRTDKLDALGNTTAAVGKGLAIGSALLTAVGLIAAFLEQSGMANRAVDLKDPIVLSGILIGSALPFIFGALTMLSVDRGARAIITEVRLQFSIAPQLMKGALTQVVDGVTYPDSTRCVRIATEAAIQEMLLPGMLAVFCPVAVGFLLGPKGLGGLLAGGLGTCFMLALMMANAGGAWDNSKKWCEKVAEDGEPTTAVSADNGGPVTYSRFGIKKAKLFDEILKEKGIDSMLKPGQAAPTTPEGLAALRDALVQLYHDKHSATVVGDTVGDPFKDTSGPSLNVLSKTMTMVALMLAPAYRGLGNQEGFQGFRSYGTIIAAVITIVISTIGYFATRHFDALNLAKYNEAIEKKKEADAKLAAEDAGASFAGANPMHAKSAEPAPAPAPAPVAVPVAEPVPAAPAAVTVEVQDPPAA